MISLCFPDPDLFKNIICKKRLNEQNKISQDTVFSGNNNSNQYFKLIDRNSVKSKCLDWKLYISKYVNVLQCYK